MIERAMRNAIAASVVVMYLATVGLVTFYSLITPEGATSVPQIHPLTKTIIDSFQTVVTVVIGFYFASSAIVEGIQRRKTGSLPGDPPA